MTEGVEKVTWIRRDIITRIVSFLFFYIGWGICMVQAKEGHPYIGPLVVLAMFLYHVLTTPNKFAEIAVTFSVAVFGSITDTLYSLFGLVEYSSPFPFLPWFAPLWIFSIWVLFAMCLNHSLAWLKYHWTLASACGLGGAIVTYAAAFRIGSGTPLVHPWLVLGIIGGLWAIIMPLSLHYSHWLYQKMTDRT